MSNKFDKNKPKLAVIDDEIYWINLIKEKFIKEYNNYEINEFFDFKKFINSEKINEYQIIITDFHFGEYNLDTINAESYLKNYKGITLLVTGYPNSVLKNNYYHKIINKTYLNKPIFKFSKYINN